jgi:hypothetical protein
VFLLRNHFGNEGTTIANPVVITSRELTRYASGSYLASDRLLRGRRPGLSTFARRRRTRKARDSKPKSKVVVTEENLVSARGPLPDMNIEGVDNSDDVIKAIDQYRRSHTSEETEQVVRAGYNQYDTLFQKAWSDNEEIKSRARDQATAPRHYSDDYRRYQEQRTAQVHSGLRDQRATLRNGLLMARIQQSLQKVRSGIQAFNLRYDWMKIRFGNGNGIGKHPYSVRLNNGVASASVPIANKVRNSMSCQIATNPASFSNSALKPCTA